MRRRIRKVLLLFPPVVFSRESPKQIMPPLGISYLAAFLIPEFEVHMLDAALAGYENERRINRRFFVYGLPEDRIIDRIKEYGPDVLGISCLYSSQFPVVARLCAMLKAVMPKVVTVAGGTHPAFLPEECLRHEGIDFIVRGEGERPLRALLRAMRDGKPVETVENIAFRSGGKVMLTPGGGMVENIDEIPFPARRLLPLEKYARIGLPMGLVTKNFPAMNMITSRGCPRQCSFCSSRHFWGGKFRPRSAANVLEEMHELRHRFGVREIKFFDDNLTQDPRRAKDIFRGMIRRGFGFSWNTPNGVGLNALDEEMIGLMKESGCYELTLAVESGDAQVLETIIRKPFDLAAVRRTARLIRKRGIDTYGFFMIGFPGETKAQIRNTLRFMRGLNLDRISLFIVNPLPGTEIYETCREKGYLRRAANGPYLDYFQARFETEEFSAAFLERTRRRWYWNCNLRLFLRNPFKFFRKYSIFVFRKPRWVWEVIVRKMMLSFGFR